MEKKEERKFCHKNEQYEEEKVRENENSPKSPDLESEINTSKLSIRQFLLDIQINTPSYKVENEAHVEELSQMKRLASEVLKLMW